jgi:hypothetical protein
VIGLSLRLALSGRRAIGRLALVASGVAVAVAIGLFVLGLTDASQRQEVAVARISTPVTTPLANAAGHPQRPFTYWSVQDSATLAGRGFTEIEAAGSGPGAPVPEGLARVPAPGEVFLSPALADFLQTPGGALYRARVPGRIVGTLGRPLVPDPSALIVVRGVAPATIDPVGNPTVDAAMVTDFARHTGVRGSSWASVSDSFWTYLFYTWLLLLVLAAPVVALLAAATRVAARTREQRLAAMRLAGASARQLRAFAVAEGLLASLAGVIAGIAIVAVLLWTLGENATFMGGAAWREDLIPLWWQAALLAVIALAAAVIGAVRGSRRIVVTPTGAGAVRRQRTRRQKIMRGIGVGLLIVVVVVPGLLLPGLFAVAALLAVPMLLAAVGARVVAPIGRVLLRGRSPARMIAGGRLVADPRRGYRMIGGVVAGVLLLAVASAAYVAVDASATHRRTDLVVATDDGNGDWGRIMAAIRSSPGVEATVPVGFAGPVVSGSCAAVAAVEQVRVLELCPPGPRRQLPSGRVWIGSPPIEFHGTTAIPSKSVPGLLVRTDGSGIALERLRDAVSAVAPSQVLDVSREPVQPLTRRSHAAAELAIAAVMVGIVALGSMALVIMDGIGERRRGYALLRALGTPRRTITNAILTEVLVPLVICSVVALAAGYLIVLAAYLVQTGHLVTPPPVYWLTALAPVLAAVVISIPGLLLLGRALSLTEAIRTP